MTYLSMFHEPLLVEENVAVRPGAAVAGSVTVPAAAVPMRTAAKPSRSRRRDAGRVRFAIANTSELETEFQAPPPLREPSEICSIVKDGGRCGQACRVGD